MFGLGISEAILLITIILYFLPITIAIIRKHKNVVAIATLNMLTGWTFIGWVVSLVWSCTKQKGEVNEIST